MKYILIDYFQSAMFCDQIYLFVDQLFYIEALQDLLTDRLNKLVLV